MSYQSERKRALLKVDEETAKRRKQSLSTYQAEAYKLKKQISKLKEEKAVQETNAKASLKKINDGLKSKVDELGRTLKEKEESLDIVNNKLIRTEDKLMDGKKLVEEKQKTYFDLLKKVSETTNTLKELGLREKNFDKLAEATKIKADEIFDRAEEFAKQTEIKRIQMFKKFEVKLKEVHAREDAVSTKIDGIEQKYADLKLQTSKIEEDKMKLNEESNKVKNLLNLQLTLEKTKEELNNEMVNTRKWADKVKAQENQNAILSSSLRRKEVELKKRERELIQAESNARENI